MKLPRIALIIVTAALVSGSSAPASPESFPQILYYEITDLEILAPEPNISDPEDYYPDATAYGVNGWGEAVGYSTAGEVQPDPFFTPTEIIHATLWLQGANYGLPTGDNDLSPGAFIQSQAKDITDSGIVVGYLSEYLGPLQGSTPSEGFLWDPVNGLTRFSNTIAPGNPLYVRAVNQAGQAVGEAWGTSTENRHAVRWQADTGLVDIGNIGFEYTKADDINEHGQIVGDGYEVNPWVGIGGPSRAFLYLPEPAYGLEAGMHSIDDWSNPDPTAYQDSTAEAINNHGQIVGWLEHQAAASEYIHVGLWLPAPAYGLPPGWTDLGSFHGDETTTFVWDLNDRGDIVGKAHVGGDVIPVFAAFHWRNGQWTDLNTMLLPEDQSVWWLDTATAVSSSGHIVGWGFRSDVIGLHPRAFLLSPVYDPAYTIFADGFESGNTSAWSLP